MEKRRPSFDLAAFRAVCGDVRRLAVIGFGRAEIAAAVKSMKATHFYKSMTFHHDHRRWQDVYHVPYEGRVLYIKFTDDAVNEFAVLSFKER